MFRLFLIVSQFSGGGMLSKYQGGGNVSFGNYSIQDMGNQPLISPDSGIFRS